MKREYYWLIGGIVAGIVFRPYIVKLPLVNKIPSV